jgi:hypothetical protein
MSQRHADIFRAIRREYDDLAAALEQASRSKNRGATGVPAYDSRRLEAAVATARDAYSLPLIATAEGFLREYLRALGAVIGDEPTLGMLIDRSFRELNHRSMGIRLLLALRQEMHDLRASRNRYAHGYESSVFPSVARVAETVSRFLGPFP